VTLFVRNLFQIRHDLFPTSDPPRLCTSAMLIPQCFSTILCFYIPINLPLESLYHLKKLHQNPLGSFNDLSIHKDRQRKATLFYTMVWRRQRQRRQRYTSKRPQFELFVPERVAESISDISPRRSNFTKISSRQILQTWQMANPSPSNRNPWNPSEVWALLIL
jgi:hypothetical protein